MTLQETQAARIAELEALNAAQKTRLEANERFRMKIGDKGGLSVFTGSRFPATLYRDQWKVIIKHIHEIEAFLDNPANVFSSK